MINVSDCGFGPAEVAERDGMVGRFSGPVLTLIQLNPMYSMIGGYMELLQK